jgi:hypothetical protein
VTNEPSVDVNGVEGSIVEGVGDTCSTPPPPVEQPIAIIDWTTLIIQENPDNDGTATQLVDEDQIYEAMGLNQGEVVNEEDGREEVPILAMSREMQEDMDEAAINVDDTLMKSHCMNGTWIILT